MFYRGALMGAAMVLVAVRLMAAPALAQSVGLTVGTPGIGGEVGFDFNARCSASADHGRSYFSFVA